MIYLKKLIMCFLISNLDSPKKLKSKKFSSNKKARQESITNEAITNEEMDETKRSVNEGIDKAKVEIEKIFDEMCNKLKNQ